MVAWGMAPEHSSTGYNVTMSGILANWPHTRLLLKTGQCVLLLGVLLEPHALRAQLRNVEQRTANGVLEGVVSADGKGRTFKGIPYAAPPVGPLRWKAAQAAAAWARG